MLDAFRRADEVLLNAVQGISDLITVPGLINVDFADVRTIMSGMGHALMGTGRAKGDRRAIEAAQQAISSPLLEDVSIDGATGILINITGGPDLTLFEVNEASSLIQEAAHEEANIIFGSVIDPNVKDEVRITVIATGFDRAPVEEGVPKRGGRTAPQMHLPYERETTKDYPPGPVKPAKRAEALIVTSPVRDAARPDDMTERGMVLTADRGEAAAAAAAQVAHGSGPTMVEDLSRGTGSPRRGGGVTSPPQPPGKKTSGPHVVPRVHPSLQQALADIDVEDELDIPAFLRRHNTPPVS
jgi:hypothetical protein